MYTHIHEPPLSPATWSSIFFRGVGSPTPKTLTIRKPRPSDDRPCVLKWSVNRGDTVFGIDVVGISICEIQLVLIAFRLELNNNQVSGIAHMQEIQHPGNVPITLGTYIAYTICHLF